MLVVAGNVKNKVSKTGLRSQPDDGNGTEFSGSVPDGTEVCIQDLAGKGAWARVSSTVGWGWIRTRNLHVQMSGIGTVDNDKLGRGYFNLSRGRQAIVGNTRWKADRDGGGTALRHEPRGKAGENLNSVVILDGKIAE